ncbi:hypothetical protein EBQ34_00290 [Vandammella animalimorsus]|uniref:Tetratricopeptide repeat protein n=1 Tax=Vandammella animalimorsus TaxID=2029117 RepID=A0A3M6RVI2_9BURK|nr:hypothetical protein [Vandammella animalimorsus]RMX18835.1 hypothetical protein EBQ34_00290 [Vandammella animalimorsus]
MVSTFVPPPIEAPDAEQRALLERKLHAVQALCAQTPHNAELHWQRACLLEQLGQLEALREALQATLKHRPDHVQAALLQVRVGQRGDRLDIDASALDAAEAAALQERQQELDRHVARRNEALLRRLRALEPDNADVLALLAQTLAQQPESPAEKLREAQLLLDRAIALAPDRIDLLKQRAHRLRQQALLAPAQAEQLAPELVVRTSHGHYYERAGLEHACADWQRCLALSEQPSIATRVGMCLHELGRFEQAVATYDRVLALMDPRHPGYAHVQKLRRRSQEGGCGGSSEACSCEGMSTALADSLDEGPHSQAQQTQPAPAATQASTAQDDLAAEATTEAHYASAPAQPQPDAPLPQQAVVQHVQLPKEKKKKRRSSRKRNAAAPASQRAASVEAGDARTQQAISIAQLFLNEAYKDAPGLRTVQAGDYPAGQRRLIDKIGAALSAAGLRHLADAEASGLSKLLGQPTLVRIYTDARGETGVAAFVIKPQWPGLLGFALQALRGQWKAQAMLTCETLLESGSVIITQWENPSPFQYEPPVYLERLPARTPVQKVLQRHQQKLAAHMLMHPEDAIVCAQDLPAIEARWQRSQHIRRAQRKAVGYATQAELKQVLGPRHYLPMAASVRLQLQRLARDYEASWDSTPQTQT